MDQLDQHIIALLQHNGRASNALIARAIEASEGTVRRRLKRLIDNEVLKIIAVPDPEKLGLGTTAIIGIQVDPDKTDMVADVLAKLEESQYVAVTTGTYDIFLWVSVHSSEDLGNFLKEKVGQIDGIRRTETFVNLFIKKRTFI